MSTLSAPTTSIQYDAADPLAAYRQRFLDPSRDDGAPSRGDDGGNRRRGHLLTSYLDGNSLGRPLTATIERLADFVKTEWGAGLIRNWDEKWMDEPTTVGDRLGEVVLGAAPGQTFIGDSTSVLLYKVLRAALDYQHAGGEASCSAPSGTDGAGTTAAQPAHADVAAPTTTPTVRNEIVIDSENFPTDRFIVEGIAAERGAVVRWISPDPATGVETADLESVLGASTAVVLLSHVAYRSGYLADAAAITAQVKAAGALMVWDLCHSVGSVPLELDAWGVDLAVGCTYKYLNGGPGSPALAYISSALQGRIQQPIWGWMGAADPFGMTEAYEPAANIRRFITGTPPILAMQPLKDMVELIAEVGMDAVREKSIALTGYAVELFDERLAPLGVELASPRDPALRGSHITVNHPLFADVTARLWEQGVIPDFRPPHGLRIGLSPLSTSFAELEAGVDAIVQVLTELR